MAVRFLLLIAFFSISLWVSVLPGAYAAGEGMSGNRTLTEQETATEKFFSLLEATLAEKFFDFRLRPKIRVAVFDFTDGEGILTIDDELYPIESGVTAIIFPNQCHSVENTSDNAMEVLVVESYNPPENNTPYVDF